MVFFISVSIFSSIIFLLVGILLAIQAKVVQKGNSRITINADDEKPLLAPAGQTLLSALASNGVFIPSACGGGGSCGMCKCKVDEGARGFLPTELVHINRKEKKANVHLACQLKVKEDLRIQLPPEILDVKKYNAVVVSNANVATFIKELVLETDPADELKFRAGAYIQIDIPEYELSYTEFRVRIEKRFRPDWDRFNLWGVHSKLEEPIFRAYSLANPPSEKNRLRFTIRIATPPPGAAETPPGKGSSFIFNLEQGDKVTLSGPYGDFFVKDTAREMCFIGGGAGMAPLRSQIRDQLETLNTPRKISFWYGARSIRELFFYDEFKALQDKHDNFSYHITLSDPQPDEKWDGPTGYVHQCLHNSYLNEHDDPTEIEYYLCGPPMMIDSVVNMLDNLGVEPEMIAYDKF
ncbi:NADH:ubiquinone reductase (Na(+)-transporting) subunit F [Desulfococcaceae bacterium HSG9]|nr:NADH:ubiquinone reductase (Na(+)-transporting) subunit F [Desulfococcaceae bacterium HSG9]